MAGTLSELGTCFSLSTYVPEYQLATCLFSAHMCQNVFSQHICAGMERVATDGRCSGIMGEPPLTGERVTGAGVC